MKIKLYIVTYRNNHDLTDNLESLFQSDWSGNHLEICVINNHSDFKLDSSLSQRIHIMHNVCRPDFSTGHLSRNWNQAIIHGFKSLNNPDCDILIHCQDDTVFHPDWCRDLVNLHKSYSFIQKGVGDNLCSYLPEAVKNIGLWDERFCGIGFQEADYFLRAKIHNGDTSSVNDWAHGRFHNRTNEEICQRAQPIIRPDGSVNHSEFHKTSMKYHYINRNIFMKKWGIEPEWWDRNPLPWPTKSLIDNYVYYPYFELDIPNLQTKNYII
jgi:hypothetical protein